VSRKLRVAALGDSITAGTPRWDPDPEVRRAISADDLDQRHQWPFWAEQARPTLEFRNHGVNRERTDEIAERLETASSEADAVVVQGGINDLVQGRTPESAAANIHELVRKANSLGLAVAVADVLPWNNGYPKHDIPIRKLNELIRSLAAEEGVPVLPFFATLEDPRRHGRMRDAWTDDGNHPSLEGHRRLGQIAVGTELQFH